MTSGLASGSCFPVGTTTVTYSATDNQNNTSTCSFTVTVAGDIPSCSISSAPTAGSYNNGVANQIIMGYGDGQIVLTATGSGGSGFTYSWSPSTGLSCTNCDNPTFTPTAGGNYTFTATVTNSIGCTSTCSITICVLDIRDPDHSDKVYICHTVPTTPNTLSVSVSAVPAHLAHGDYLGMCGQSCATSARMTAGNIAGDQIKVYPNPNNGAFTVELPYIEDKATITVADIAGKTILKKIVRNGEDSRLNLQLSDVAKGVYFVDVVLGDQHFRTKLIIQ
jgi:hypothetical protein